MVSSIRHNIVLIISCALSVLFLAFIFKLTWDFGHIEKNLIASKDVVDITNSLKTTVIITSKEFVTSEWIGARFDDSSWDRLKIPIEPINQKREFLPGNYVYYRIVIPKTVFFELSHLRSQVSLYLQYIFHKRIEFYINGVFFQALEPKNPLESLIPLPLDITKDNIVSLKAQIGPGDTGILHRSSILAGRNGELNELHRQSYKNNSVASLIYILCKGSIFFVFTLIFMFVKVERFFEYFLLFAVFVLGEDVIVSGAFENLNYNFEIYLYNLCNIGILWWLFLFLSEVVSFRFSFKVFSFFLIALAFLSHLIVLDTLNANIFFNIDSFLKFWRFMHVGVLLFFCPFMIKHYKIASLVLLISAATTAWSIYVVDFNLKAFSSLLLFFLVAYQTFIMFRRQQNQLMEQEKDVAIGRTAAILAHDVRRPLDQMSLILNRLIAGEATEEFLKVAKSDVEFSLASVNNQISDIMNYVSTKKPELLPVSFYGILAGSIKQVMANRTSLDLKLLYDFQANFQILGDESRLANVLSNLVANSVEAIVDMGKSSTGLIKFSTKVLKDRFHFKIYNDGPAIPDSVINEIFKPLFTSGKSKGTGLGLSSVSKVMDDLGGSVHVNNIPGGGVEFTLEFKLASIDDQPDLKLFKDNSKLYGYGPDVIGIITDISFIRIFLLDDDKYIYEYFLDLFKKLPFEVELSHYSNVEEAAKAISSKRYDLYLLDYDLGGNETGLDFYKKHLSFLKHGVIIHTNRDKATLVNCNLPIYSKPIDAITLTKLCEDAYKKRLKILLVEDSRIFSIAWLMFHGKHNLTLAKSPEEALELLERDNNEFHCCVTDYYFDNSSINGEELAQILNDRYPQLLLLISSSNFPQNSQYKYIPKNHYDIRSLLTL